MEKKIFVSLATLTVVALKAQKRLTHSVNSLIPKILIGKGEKTRKCENTCLPHLPTRVVGHSVYSLMQQHHTPLINNVAVTICLNMHMRSARFAVHSLPLRFDGKTSHAGVGISPQYNDILV
jgi:hypothetical protein